MVLATALPELAADQVEARVDSRGGSGARDDAAVIDEEDVRVDPGLGEAALQLRRVPPVRGAVAAVEQAGGAERERTGADAEQDGAPVVGAAQRIQKLFRVLVADRRRRDGDEVGVLHRLEPVRAR